MADPVETVLARLESVRPNGPDKWSAKCPAHDDRTPSLAVARSPSGTCLLYCFAGCTVEHIAGALALNLSDLFPPRLSDDFDKRGLLRRRKLRPSPLVAAIENDLILIRIFLSDVGKGRMISAYDMESANAAANRIGEYLNAGRYVA